MKMLIVGAMCLALISFGISDVSKTNSYFIESIGLQNVHNYFPDVTMLTAAIELMNRHILISNDLFTYATCDTIESLVNLSEYFHNSGIDHAHSFASAISNVGCLTVTLTNIQRNKLPSYLPDLLPIPHILKADISVLHLLNFDSTAPIVKDMQVGAAMDLEIILSSPKLSARALVNKLLMKLNAMDGWSTHAWSVDRSVLNRHSPLSRHRYVNSRGHVLMSAQSQAQSSVLEAMWTKHFQRAKQLLDEDSLLQTCSYHGLLEFADVRGGHIRVALPADYFATGGRAACLAHLTVVLASMEGVVKFGVVQPVHLLNDVTRAVLQIGAAAAGSVDTAATPYSVLGLDGSGVVVGVSDTGIDQNSCFFRDLINGHVYPCSIDSPTVDLRHRKVVQYVNYSGSSGDVLSGHGSHVAGTIAGQCDELTGPAAAKALKNGVASGAKLAFFDIHSEQKEYLQVPGDISEVFQPARFAGANIHSNSWGGGYWYDAYCLQVDEFLYKHDDFLAIFAGGNNGGTGYESVLSPGLSKNALAVAAADHGTGNIAGFSSVGPAPDGRIKPDIAAPGVQLESAHAAAESSNAPNCDTTAKSGTSMATPAAAGAAALVTQYFADEAFWASFCNQSYPMCQRGASKISGSLLKALLIQSGSPLALYNGGNAIGKVPLHVTPDIFQGYGRITLASILPQQMIGPMDLFVDELVLITYSEVRYDIEVTNSHIPFAATISWFDPPSSAFVAMLLRHDLDLVVISPDGTIYYGNYYASTGANATRDEVNNNERVLIPAPILVGTWQLRVQAKLLTEADHQKVSLVVNVAGSVSGDGLSHTLHMVDPRIFQQCHLTTNYSESSSQLDVSLWSLTTKSWAAGDVFLIQPAALAGTFSSILTMKNELHATYNVKTLCVYPQCYTATLLLADANNHLTDTQASIAACDVFLSAMTPQQQFCVNHVPKQQVYGGVARDVMTQQCSPVCLLRDHTLLRLQLLEESGQGWQGSYFAVQEIIPKTKLNVATAELSPLSSGTLEWGSSKEDDLCLPVPMVNCFLLQLVKNNEEASPILAYLNYGTNAPAQCPYLTANSSLAIMCVKPELGIVSVHSFATRVFNESALHDYVSVVPTHDANAPSYTLNINTQHVQYLNTCQVQLSTSSMPKIDTDVPEPSDELVVEPPHSNQSTSLSSLNHTCLETCPLYSSFAFEERDFSSLCDFLMSSIYEQCGSFNIAAATCGQPACVASCSSDVLCYLGAAAVRNCPYWSSSSWDDSSQSFSAIYNSCQVNSNNITTQGEASDAGTDHAASSRRALVIVLWLTCAGLFIIAAILGIKLAMYNIVSSTIENAQLPLSSSHDMSVHTASTVKSPVHNYELIEAQRQPN